MTAPASEQMEAEIERRVAAQTADLRELLGHLNACWDEEKRHLARQLHDSLGSSMTALTMHLALLSQQMPAEKALLQRTAQMKTLLNTIIATNRAMQSAVWNDKLEFLGVRSALAELVAEFGTQHALTARLSLPDDEARYDSAQSVALLRTVEEGLRNVLAHAQATEVDVILDDNEDEIMLTIRDNGIGPAAYNSAALGCHGLRLLAERMRYLGGAMRFAAAPGKGSALTVTLPRAPVPVSAA
ncbi:MAG: sensor histidine kinase [Massilia sp.]